MAKYIDYDLFKKDLEKRWDVNDDSDFANKEVWHALEEAPAADVRPVVRGKWNTVKYPLYECSNCGAVYQEVGYGFNFCPNCGAKMEDDDDGRT